MHIYRHTHIDNHTHIYPHFHMHAYMHIHTQIHTYTLTYIRPVLIHYYLLAISPADHHDTHNNIQCLTSGHDITNLQHRRV